MAAAVADRVVKHLCITCGKHFSKSCNLARHMRIHSAEMLMCSHCGKEFKTSDYLRNHMRKEHSGEERPIVCLICGLLFTIKKDLKRHMKQAHKGQKPPRLPYVCLECGKGFGQPRLLQDHMVTHTGAKPYNCLECGQGFLHQYKYEKHMEIHWAKKQNICSECGQGFGTHGRLAAHMQTHVMHKCPDCGKEFKSEASLMIHYNQHTNPFECSACGKGFSDESMLKKHMSIHTTCPGAPDVCPECGRWFSDLAQLKDHMWSHKPDAQFLCPECHRSFGTPTALKIHMRSHSGVKTHVCSGCGRGFSTAGYLENHLSSCNKTDGDSNQGDTSDASPETKEAANADTQPVVASGSKGAPSNQSHVCPTCGKTFKFRSHLEVHQRTHTGARPYVCDECGNGFTEAGSLRRHQLIHQGEKPFSCIHCFITFRTSAQLKAHTDKRHADTQDTQYACAECMKVLPSPAALKVHMIIHEQDSHVCPQCGKGYKTSHLLNTHLQTHRTTTTDAENTESSELMETDVQTKRGVNKRSQKSKTVHYQCPTCGKEFEKQNHLRAHMKRHTAVRQFWCRRCGKGFAEAVVLRRHMLTHGGKKPVQCMECGKRFMDSWHLKVHLQSKTHRHRKHIPCPTCGIGVSSKDALERHMQIHARKAMGEQDDEKTPDLETEGKSSEEADRNSNHSDQQMLDFMGEESGNTSAEAGSGAGDENEVNSNHSNVGNLDIFNDDVNEKTSDHLTSESINTDLQTQEGPDGESGSNKITRANQIKPSECHVCNTCGAQFPTISEMRAHMKKERCYVCAECGRGFGEAVVLRRHMVTHGGKKPKQCLVCGKRFMDAYKLNKHMRTHNNKKYYSSAVDENNKSVENNVEHVNPLAEQPAVQVKEEPIDVAESDEEYVPKSSRKQKRRHMCLTCGKDFTSAWNLKAHMKRHTMGHSKERPYVCSDCGKAFAEAVVLKRHKLTHGGEKPKQCSECGKRFMDATHLREHIWTHSKEKAYTCPLCHKGLSTKYSLANHMKGHMRENAHVCPECGRDFKTLDDLNDHVEKHIKSVEMQIKGIESEMYDVSAQPETGNVSPISQRQTRSRTSDSKMRTSETLHVCSDCGQGFENSDQLDNHSKSHTIKLECIDETENTTGDLNPEVLGLFENYNHTRLGRLDPPETETYQNHLSPQILDVLNDHRRAHAANAESVDSNEVEAFSNYSDSCGTEDVIDDHLTTETKSNVNLDRSNMVTSHEHMITGLVESESGNTVTRGKTTENSGRNQTQVSQVVAGAEQKASDDDDTVCPICSKVFRRKRNLKAHMVTHSKARPFVCEECGDGFTEAGSLRRHMRIHTGEKPFPCTQCHKTFRTSTHLKKHTLTHKGYVYNREESHAKKRKLRKNTENTVSYMNLQVIAKDTESNTGKIGGEAVDRNEAETTQSLLGQQILDLIDDQWKPHAAEGGGLSSDEEVASHHSESSVSLDLDDDHPPIVTRDLDDSGTDLNQTSLLLSDKAMEKEKSDTLEKPILPKSERQTGDDRESAKEIDSLQKNQPTKAGNRSNDQAKKRQNQPYPGVSRVKGRAKRRPAVPFPRSADGKAVCPLCSKVFNRMSNLKAHFVTHSKARPFVCEECGDGFTEAGSLRRHMRIHTGEKPFPCTQCDKTFRTSTHLKAHVRTHMGTKEFQCPECKRSFSTTSSLKLHSMLHTGEKPYICLVCHKGFRLASHLDYHMISHSAVKLNKKVSPTDSDDKAQIEAKDKVKPTKATDKPHMCPECGKCFGTNGILKKHKMTHTGDKPYLCSECGKKFVDATKLNQHMGTHRKEKFYSCSECGKGFSGLHSLKSHIKRKHPGDGASVCLCCGKGFRSSALLGEHFTTCSKVKAVSDSVSTEALENAQPNERPHVCFECGKGFGTRGILKKHLMTHTGERPHECSFCGRKFTQYTHLKRHLMTHTGEKPFGCSECGQRFASSAALDIHFRLHTGEKPYACVWCGEAYRTLGLLYTHTRTCYGGRHGSNEGTHLPHSDNQEASAFMLKWSQAGRREKAVLETAKEYIYSSCYLCVQGFDRVSDLIEHLAVHALTL